MDNTPISPLLLQSKLIAKISELLSFLCLVQAQCRFLISERGPVLDLERTDEDMAHAYLSLVSQLYGAEMALEEVNLSLDITDTELDYSLFCILENTENEYFGEDINFIEAKAVLETASVC